ncbi:MAG: Ig-like domain-containing protein [Gemmatimonadaceae bacterium]
MRRIVAVTAAIFASACGGGSESAGPTPPPAASVASVTVTPDAAQLLPAQTSQLTATARDASGNALAGRTIDWSSSASGVASVSTSGLVTAVTAGSATITATSEGKSGSAVITVLAPVASVSLDVTTATLAPAGTLQLTATPREAGGGALAGRAVAWSSSAPGVATVSTTGLVTAVTVGTTTITATSEGKSAAATVTVAPPVATVTLDHATATLVPNETMQLTAITKDASGATLAGRAVTWTSSVASVATVSSNGLMTGVSKGTTTVTATSETKSASAVITVNEGGYVTASGGTVVALGGDLTLDFPAGAVPGGTSITVETSTQPAATPASGVFPATTFYKLGPDGITFPTPVTVTLKYDPTTLPPWGTRKRLGLQRWNGTQWSALTNISVDTVAHTISGKTPGFSTVGTYVYNPTFSVTPSPGSVNYVQRSVTLTVTDDDTTGIAGSFQYDWKTTGSNGSLSWAANLADAQYTATTPIIPDGDIDMVECTISAPWAGIGRIVTLGKVSVKVNSNLGLSFALNPWTQLANFDDHKTVKAEVRDKSGALYQGQLLYMVDTTRNAGDFMPVAGPLTKTTNNTFAYASWGAASQKKTPVRGDQLHVAFYSHTRVIGGTFLNPTISYVDTKIGEADAYIEVGKDTYVGRFAVETVPSGGGACVYAYLYAPKVTPSPKKYDLTAHHFNDPGGYGTQFAKSWTAATGSGLTDVQDAGTEWRMGLDGGCAQSQSAITYRQNLYATRFFGIEVEVKVTP